MTVVSFENLMITRNLWTVRALRRASIVSAFRSWSVFYSCPDAFECHTSWWSILSLIERVLIFFFPGLLIRIVHSWWLSLEWLWFIWIWMSYLRQFTLWRSIRAMDATTSLRIRTKGLRQYNRLSVIVVSQTIKWLVFPSFVFDQSKSADVLNSWSVAI